jgi:RNA polymerase sigma factor (sigma-70 family)
VNGRAGAGRPGAPDGAAVDEAGAQSRQLTFDAFHQYHHKPWLRFTQIHVGGRRSAEAVVDAACRELLRNWEHVLRQPSVPAYAWAVLKDHVARWLREHDLEPALPGTAAFHATVRRLRLYEPKDEFAVLEGALALYTAISRLPERQYDVIVLRFVLGVSDEDIAGYLGSGVGTVHSHIRHAKRRLARELDTLLEADCHE